MGREIRRVPFDWEHPRDEQGEFIPQLAESYRDALAAWEQALADWLAGGAEYQDARAYAEKVVADPALWNVPYDRTAPEQRAAFWRPFLAPPTAETFVAYRGGPLDPSYYRTREWSPDEPLGYQLYENTTEGTPLSPVCRTRDEMIEWLSVVLGLSTEAAARFVDVGSAPSFVVGFSGGVLTMVEGFRAI